MKKCPYCSAQIADNSRFCSECGKEITQAYDCPHCGVSVGEGDAFCQNCGKSLNETTISEPIAYEEEQLKSGFKKYLPYILGGILLLGIIGYLGSMGSNEGNNNPSVVADSMAVADSVAVADEDTETSSEQEEVKLITEWYDYVFGKKEISDDVLNKFLSSNVKKRIWTEDYEGCYEYWKFRTSAQDYDPNVGDVSKIEDISVNNDGWYEVKYLDMGYNGKTTIKVENSQIVDFVPDSSWNNNETSVENSNNVESDNSNYSKYIGKWSNYIVSQGQRVKVYTAIIHNDLTAEWITYLPDGSVNTSMSFRQCVFQDGYVYFTDNGDTSIKGTPRFRLGSSGLQTADGENMVKE